MQPTNTKRLPGIAAGLSIAVFSAGLLFFCSYWVDFTPKVSPEFFFSKDSPQFQAEKAIVQEFGQPNQIILNIEGELTDEDYRRRLLRLGEEINAIPEVFNIFSLAESTDSYEKALQSPLWSRLLLNEAQRSSNVIVFIEQSGSDGLAMPPQNELITQLETLIEKYKNNNFNIKISGMPYIVEQMRRHLIRDLQVFSVCTFVIFGLLLFLQIRTLGLVAGMLLACANAAALTLIINQALGMKLGLLTANMITITATLTLSHLVFLTFNWSHIKASPQKVRKAVRKTLPPSFWSMLTTVLGFGSLLFVDAEPLRKLGVSGIIASFAAFVMTYLQHPWVLWIYKHGSSRMEPSRLERAVGRFFTGKHTRVAALLCIVPLVLGVFIFRLEKDPSLLSYFAKGGELRQGLETIDARTGSAPLTIVVENEDGKSLASEDSYQRMWELQLNMESHKQVGSVLSLPVLLAEARRVPILGKVLPWGLLVELMESPLADKVARYFITQDRTQGLFMLMMREASRDKSRSAIIEELEQSVVEAGFKPVLVGGVYALQSALTRMVFSSLVQGLLLLLTVFFLLIFLLTRHLKTTASVMLSLILIPCSVLGILGLFRVPFDVISAPAVNLALAMGVDAVIHLLSAKKQMNSTDAEGWKDACAQMWRPICVSALVVFLGFGVFGFSIFPPTQRFGLSIMLGTALVPFVSLLVLPYISLRHSGGLDFRALRQRIQKAFR